MPAQPDDRPAKLPAIERVQVILPCSPPHDPAHLQAGIDWLRNVGVTVAPPEPRDERPLAHLAGSDRARARELAGALLAAPVDAVWCGRGGSGALRTLTALRAVEAWAEDAARGNTPRWVADSEAEARPSRSPGRSTIPLIGLSDATALLLERAFGSEPGVAVHGPVITQLTRLDDGSADALRTWMREPDRLPTLRADEASLVPGVAEGELIGGNLSLLAACAGTAQAVRTEGRILLIEDVAEPAYRIDRLLAQLHRSGALAGIAAVACGTFSACPHPPAVAACLRDWAARLGVPWAGQFPVGHSAACRPVGLGVRYRLSASDGILRPLETLSEALQRREAA